MPECPPRSARRAGPARIPERPGKEPESDDGGLVGGRSVFFPPPTRPGPPPQRRVRDAVADLPRDGAAALARLIGASATSRQVGASVLAWIVRVGTPAK